MSENEMIIIDGDSPPPLTNLSLEPMPTVEPKNVQSKMDDFVTKETRQVRQRKLFRKDDYVYDGDSVASSPNSSGDEIDDVDTDDLLSQADNLPPLRFNSVGRATTIGKGKRRTTRRRKPATNVKKQPPRRRIDDYRYDPEQTRQLAEAYPDNYWVFHADAPYPMIDVINQDCPLGTLGYNVTDQGAITGMTLSPDGALLATFSTVGIVKIWDVTNEFNLLRRMRDLKEENIEEFYCGQFSPTQELIAAGGKLKDRFRWSVQDEDNHILPCPLKLFNVETGQTVTQLDGHAEEILCVKALTFKGENYFITTSQDGYIIKWKMEENWSTLVESTKMEDGITCMAFTVSFVPNTGNKFFVAACDAHLRLYDFEEALLLQTFEDIYSSYCDCGKFIKWLDEPAAEGTSEEPPHAYFVSRGAEICDVAEGVSSIPNTCTLHKLVFPTEQGGKFQLEQVRRFNHEDYHANCWFVKITSNGRYLLAPTIYGQIFVFNMASGQVTAVLKDHQDIEIRDVIFHPYQPLLFSCGDDGCVKVYTFRESLPPSPTR